MIQDGMDVARAREIAGSLRAQSSMLDDIAVQGNAMMRLLEDVWSGPDVEEFARGWQEAGPQIDRAGQMVQEMGDELLRQAEDQDRASAGHGLGPGGPLIPPLPPVLPFPPLPALPNIFGVLMDVLRGIWDFLQSLFYAIPEFIAGVVGFVDEATDFLASIKWLKWLKWPLIILGKVTPFLSAVLGLWDLGESIYRFFTEGFSKDSVLQFFQGLTGAIAGGLGIAALFATGTILGAPAALVLGAGALIFGALSLGISIYREFDDEIDGAVQWLWEKGLIGGPLNPNVPKRPGWPLPLPEFPPPTGPGPTIPEPPKSPGPGMPEHPGPGLPKLPGPGLPKLPGPGLPQVPGLPSIPALPGVPKPSFPGIPMPRLW